MITYHIYILLLLLLLFRSYITHNYLRQKSGLQKISIQKHFSDDNRLLYFMLNLKFYTQKETNSKLIRLKVVINILTVCCWLIILSSISEFILSFFE